MNTILFIILFSAIFGGAIWALYLKEALAKPSSSHSIANSNAVYIIAVLAIGFIVRVICAVSYEGHPTDMACFSGWSTSIFNGGLRNFYLDDGFHDYPPGYVYVMYVLGAVKTGLNLHDGGLWLWLKLPSIIADMVMGWLTYKLANRKFNDAISATFAAFVIFNPAVIVDSAVWGQIDSILALFCVLSVYCVAERKFIPSFFWFAAGVLIKPQAAFFAPVIIFGLIEELFIREKFSAGKLIKYILWAAAAVAAMLILFMPFGNNPFHGISVIVGQYVSTLGEYEYMTVNAFNLYAAIGKNWTGLGVVSRIIGYGMMAVVVAYSAYIYFKSKSPTKAYMTAFMIVFGIFMLAIKMHERYAYPGIFMLAFAIAVLPTPRTFLIYGLFSLSQLYNYAWSLFVYDASNYWDINGAVAPAGIINVLIFIVVAYLIYIECVKYKPEAVTLKGKANKGKSITTGYVKRAQKPVKKTISEREFQISEPELKLNRWDIIVMAVIVIVYSVIALYNLGNRFAPETELVLSSSPVTVDLGETKEVSKVSYYLGARQLEESRAITIRYLDDHKKHVVEEKKETSGSVFCWNTADGSVNARYIELVTDHVPPESDPTDLIYLNEVCLIGSGGELIEPVNADDESVAALFDEQDKYVEGKDFMSGTYFDEIYHGRTAYEFIHHMTVYEWTHPPLGKVFIGIGILLFGMVPFGWRIAGTVFGIGMIPIIYMFARRMLKHRGIAAVTCIIFTFDFMHFVQTRISTIDVYVTFFIMLMYYFMYKYYTMSFYDTPLKKTLIPLGLSGIFFGFAVASKWTGLYGGAGLAIIFFYTMYRRYEEYRYAMSKPKGETLGIAHKKVISEFNKNAMITIAFCVVMFVVVPAFIYTMSYIPYFNTPSGHGLKTIFENADSMYTYHSKTVVDSTHPYSSHWYEWPIMYRPLWYFSNTTADGLKQGISAFGNPAVWWLGIGAVAYMLALAIVIPLKKRKYYNMNKFMFLGVYALVFAVLCAAAYSAGSANEKLERLFSCVLLYSCVMVGIFGLVLLFDDQIKQKSAAVAAFLLIGYFIELVPWIPVARTTYIYHYFPCVPFTVLMIGYAIRTFYDNAKNKRAVIAASFVYAAVAVGLFILFYPVLAGKPIQLEFAEHWLKWFSSWVLVA
ncbi:MAG: glycosyltransferase family 39 protein [Clostridia bacterium]|nr:glycosyltransferase family 39 protein [Clostridia bacterium]